MNPLKKLASQTAIYGLSTIVGRLLNYFLVPIYTRVFLPGEYGVVTQMYAIVTFLNVAYTYGMETAFFRFSQLEKDNPRIYSTNLISIISSSVILGLLLIIFSNPIAAWMGYEGHGIYIIWFALILAFDAITAIPFAKLRLENKAKKYASIKFLWIISNVFLNLFFLVACPTIMKGNMEFIKPLINAIYNPEMGVGYVFISNLISSFITLLILLPEITGIRFSFDTILWKKMLQYALPLLIAGFAGMINEVMDRLMMPYLVADKSTALTQIGIYGACYKVSILMTLFIQTFRQAAEPFFFTEANAENSKKIYADVMTYFVIACSIIFLGVMMNMEIVKHFVGIKYRSGLTVVPILLLANLCLGIFFNLSIWYKLSGHTKWGAYLAIFGAIITLTLNIWWIPLIGYMGAAWATLVCYALMMLASYAIGQRYYPVSYNLPKILGYLALSLALYFLSDYLTPMLALNKIGSLLFNNLFLCAFLLLVILKEIPNLKSLRIRK